MVEVLNLQYNAYRSIRHMIMTFELVPGEKINEKDLIEQLNMSRTPVHEALLQLRSDGLVKTVPQSGTYVTKINLNQAENGRFIRQTLEEKIFPAAISNVSTYDLDLLREGIRKEQIFLENREFDLFFKEDEAFHRYFYELNDRIEVWEWVQKVTLQLNRFRWLRLKVDELSWNILSNDHEEILKALADGRDHDILNLVHRHEGLMIVERDIVVKKYPDFFEN